MSTKIEWATETWNPVTGCTPVSEACQNCYAKRMANRLRGRFGYPEDEPFRVTLHPEKLDEPLKWKKPRRVFVCSMGDLFHEKVHPYDIMRIFNVMAQAKQHTFMVLTKRPENLLAFYERLRPGVTIPGPYFSICGKGQGYAGSPPRLPDNIWIGVTAENQQRADERIPILLQIPAAVRFVSVEPMLGPVDLSYFINSLDWVICGGETGPGARPMHPDWVRSIRDQCRDAGTPFFFKQWGDWAPIPTKDVPVIGCADGGRFHDGPNPSRGLAMYRVGNKAAGNLIDGQEWRQYPECE